MKVQPLITTYYKKSSLNNNSCKNSYRNPFKKQSLITNYYKKKVVKVYGYNDKTGSFHCLSCGIDMGPQNPRQLCSKYYCPYDFENKFS